MATLLEVAIGYSSYTLWNRNRPNLNELVPRQTTDQTLFAIRYSRTR